MNEDEEKKESSRQIAAYVTLPFALAVPPIIGWALGSWLDSYFKTSPYLMFALIALGFIAGIREFYRIVTKVGKNNDE